jgi:CubicO group peptidase (beta-lactamase class C family)
MKRVFLLALVLFCLPGIALSQSPNAKAEALLRREMSERRIPGLQAAVVQNGKIVLLSSLGTADLQSATPVSDKSVFGIYSCTKAFTGVAVMQLVEDGKLDLSAPVSRYLDGLPTAWQPVTIRQLLTHVSGLPNILRALDPVTYGFPSGTNEEAAWTKTKAMPLEFTTGERFSYNQTNYALLGKIIDKLAGKPFAEVFRERQFDVAAAAHTGFGDSRDVTPNMVRTYRYVNQVDGQKLSAGKLVHDYVEFPPFRRTASGMNSTAEDLAHWVIALQQGKLLRTKSALETLWTAGTFNNGARTQWALGWMTKPHAQHSAIVATGGGRTAIFVYPEDELAVIVLTNLANSYPEEFVDELAGFYNPDISASDSVTALRIELRQRGYEHAIEVFDELKQKNPVFQSLDRDRNTRGGVALERSIALERALNDWAYRMLNGGGKPKEALEIFKLNVYLFPNSANVYDSVAEAYAVNGQRALAIQNYKRSLELDPKNTNAVQQLKKLDPSFK